jgi:serine/threonine protein kinase
VSNLDSGGSRPFHGSVRVGRYLVVDVVDPGTGLVYAAYDPECDRTVALRFIDERSLPDARATLGLRHPNVVGVIDVGKYRGRAFITTEFVHGTTLTEWLRQRWRTWQEIAETFRQAAIGLGAAHEAGLVHRHFRSDVVFATHDGRVRVGGFGAAAASAYVAPEQHRGHEADALTDQLCFCAALHDALVENEALRGASIPAWLRRVVLRGLSEDRAQRFADMRALAVALAATPESALRR